MPCDFCFGSARMVAALGFSSLRVGTVTLLFLHRRLGWKVSACLGKRKDLGRSRMKVQCPVTGYREKEKCQRNL